MRIALISPKGPLYRQRGGIYKKPLRYAPRTLSTLASQIPPGIEHKLVFFARLGLTEPRAGADAVNWRIACA